MPKALAALLVAPSEPPWRTPPRVKGARAGVPRTTATPQFEGERAVATPKDRIVPHKALLAAGLQVLHQRIVVRIEAEAGAETGRRVGAQDLVQAR